MKLMHICVVDAASEKARKAYAYNLVDLGKVTGREVRLPVDMPVDQTFLAVELTWE